MNDLMVFDSVSSGTSAYLYTADGDLVSKAFTPLSISLNGSYAQQDPREWWASLVSSSRSITNTFDAAQIAAVSFTAQCMCCLCVDGNGTPLYPALTWSDTRAAELGSAVLQNGSAQYAVTGTPDHFGSSIQKLNWFRNRRPEIYARTAKALQCKDYLVYCLTGQMCTDFSDASCSCAFDLRQRQWCRSILDQLHLEAGKLPDAFPSDTVIGSVSRQAAAETGLTAGTPVVIGGQDFICSALGAGCIHPGDIYISLGSSSWVASCSNHMILDSTYGISNQILPGEGIYLSMANLQGVGTVFKWLRNRILRYANPESDHVDPYRNIYPYTGLGERLCQSPPGANGLLFLPYLLENAPNRPGPWASAAYIGMTWQHSQKDLLRAAAEGVIFDIKTYVDLFARCSGGTPPELTVVGAASRETELLQLMADILSIPIKTLFLKGSPDSVGATILAGNGIGLFDGYDQAHRFWSVSNCFQPEPARSAYYQQLYSLFLDASARLLPLQKRLVDLNLSYPHELS